MAQQQGGQQQRRRVKVDIIHAENQFFGKVLAAWRANAADRNDAHTLKTAADSLRKCPLRVSNYTELRALKGIGDDFATRLDAALAHFKQHECSEQAPFSLARVRAMPPEQAFRCLCESTVSRGSKKIPFLSAEARAAVRAAPAPPAQQPEHSTGQGAASGPAPTLFKGPAGSLKPTTSTDCLSAIPAPLPTVARPLRRTSSAGALPVDPLAEFKAVLNARDAVAHPQPANQSKQTGNDSPLNSNGSDEEEENAENSADILRHRPNGCISMAANVLLIVDNREVRAKGRAKSMCELLEKRGVRHEQRSLAAGDFLWVLQLGPGAGPARELVLDYVVERKTWDDLKTSLRQSRYQEQKQRLKQTGLRHRVLLAEGTDAQADPTLEQALVSTAMADGFLVQRVQSVAETARFLDDVTKRLKQRVDKEEFTGPSFAAFQDESRKTKQLTVADCFLKQLTVCPQLSSRKAAAIVAHFPTLRALRQLYQRNQQQLGQAALPAEECLSAALPSAVNPALSKQLAAFFQDQ